MNKDCFGTYDQKLSECQHCADSTICMILLQEESKKEKLLGETVSSWDFKGVPTDKLKVQLKSGEYTIEDVRAVFVKYSKCTDMYTVNVQVNRFLSKNKFKINEGYVTSI